VLQATGSGVDMAFAGYAEREVGDENVDSQA
jgi:hypothetical protein